LAARGHREKQIAKPHRHTHTRIIYMYISYDIHHITHIIYIYIYISAASLSTPLQKSRGGALVVAKHRLAGRCVLDGPQAHGPCMASGRC
jgi:hypothetical protein